MELLSYEFFTDGFSTIVQAKNITEAIIVYKSEHGEVPIAIITVGHPIYNELLSSETTPAQSGELSRKIVVWKDGTYKEETGATWEYENDEDWLVTINL